MKQIKLLTLTSLNYVVVFSVLTLVFFSFFFYITQKDVSQSTDEALRNRKWRILKEIKKDGNKVPADAFNFTDFKLNPTAEMLVNKDFYADTMIYESGDDEASQYRKLTAITTINNQFYKLEIVIPVMEKDEIVSSLIKTLALVFVLMVVSFFFTTRLLSKKLWRPFYNTMNKLDEFEIDRTDNLDLKSSRIYEFNTLNQSIKKLTAKAKDTFESQKQFIENASHELQTPLAINQNKLEQLIDDASLTEKQSEIVQTLINSTQRMTRLNKTLLLLSKIENKQFPDIEPVLIAPLVRDVLYVFEDQKILMHITVKNNIDEQAFVVGNRILIDLLISNLIKNAFVHNYDGGTILISFIDKRLSISNTSQSEKIPDEKLFQRFYKNTNRKESWGLGLAIVNKICILNNWKINYSQKETLHHFTVLFN